MGGKSEGVEDSRSKREKFKKLRDRTEMRRKEKKWVMKQKRWKVI